jgi:hypothetical protein
MTESRCSWIRASQYDSYRKICASQYDSYRKICASQYDSYRKICASQYDSYRKIQQDAAMYKNFVIPYLSEAQYVSGDTPPFMRSLKLHWKPLVFHMWKVVGLCLTMSTNYMYKQPATYEKPEAASAVLGST